MSYCYSFGVENLRYIKNYFGNNVIYDSSYGLCGILVNDLILNNIEEYPYSILTKILSKIYDKGLKRGRFVKVYAVSEMANFDFHGRVYSSIRITNNDVNSSYSLDEFFQKIRSKRSNNKITYRGSDRKWHITRSVDIMKSSFKII